jgi:hypothetical protein
MYTTLFFQLFCVLSEVFCQPCQWGIGVWHFRDCLCLDYQQLMWWVLCLHTTQSCLSSVPAQTAWGMVARVRWSLMSYLIVDYMENNWISEFMLIVIGPSIWCFFLSSVICFIMFMNRYNEWCRGNLGPQSPP